MWPFLFAILSAAGVGFNSACVQLGMRYSQVTGAQALIINLIAGNIILIIVGTIVFLKHGVPELNLWGIVFFTLAGLMGPFFGRLLSFSAIKRIGATHTSVYRMSDIFFTMLLALFLLNDEIKLKGLIGSILLTAGVVILLKEKVKPASGDSGKAPTVPILDSVMKEENNLCRYMKGCFHSGVFLALTCGMFFSFGGIFREFGIDLIPSAILGTLISTLVALVANSIYTFSTKQWGNNWEISRKSVICFALGGFGNSLGILTFFLALMNGVPVAMVAALKSTSPLFTLFFSWIMLRKVEKFSLKLVTSIFLVIIGSTLIVS